MKVYLCRERGCCPSVEVKDDCVTIGEGNNTCTLAREEWNILKDKIKSGEL